MHLEGVTAFPILLQMSLIEVCRIGGACAKALYLQHVHLALSYNSNRNGVEKLAEGLKEEYKRAHSDREAPFITLHQADLSNTEETLKLAGSASAEHGRAVDILIANAGFGKRITDIE